MMFKFSILPSGHLSEFQDSQLEDTSTRMVNLGLQMLIKCCLSNCPLDPEQHMIMYRLVEPMKHINRDDSTDINSKALPTYISWLNSHIACFNSFPCKPVEICIPPSPSEFSKCCNDQLARSPFKTGMCAKFMFSCHTVRAACLR